MKSILLKVGILILLVLLYFILPIGLGGCSPYNTRNIWRININKEGIIESAEDSRFDILSIQNEPLQIDACPRQPEKLVEEIINFRGYNWHFKFENQLKMAQGKHNELWWPY